MPFSSAGCAVASMSGDSSPSCTVDSGCPTGTTPSTVAVFGLPAPSVMVTVLPSSVFTIVASEGCPFGVSISASFIHTCTLSYFIPPGVAVSSSAGQGREGGWLGGRPRVVRRQGCAPSSSPSPGRPRTGDWAPARDGDPAALAGAWGTAGGGAEHMGKPIGAHAVGMLTLLGPRALAGDAIPARPGALLSEPVLGRRGSAGFDMAGFGSRAHWCARAVCSASQKFRGCAGRSL